MTDEQAKASLEAYRSRALQAAKELQYPSDCMWKILKAKNETQIANIMAEARHKFFN